MSYNEELNNYIKNIIFDNKIIYDIGANEGEITKFIFDNSKNSTINCVEPHPDNINILNNKFNNISNIKIINGAVNTFDGNCNIGLEKQQRKNGLKQGHVMETTDLQGRLWENKLKVKCYKLDNLCNDANIIKMDIEGFEHKILPDLLPNLNNVDIWILEIHSWEDIKNHGWTINEHNIKNDSLNKLLNLFLENNYKNFIIAKTMKNKIKQINKNTNWNDIPLCSYKFNKKLIYYKVLNLIIKK
jgi:FkbM family methyltransferase